MTNLCPHCKLKRKNITHTRICKLKPSRTELYNWRVVQHYQHWKIAEILSKRHKRTIDRCHIPTWIELYNIPEIARTSRGSGRVPKIAEQVLKYLSSCAGETVTVHQIRQRCNVSGWTALKALREMSEGGQAVQLDRTNWQLTGKRNGKTQGEYLREAAGWPPLENWKGELWQR